MKDLDFTTVTAIDREHAAELRHSFPTWIGHHPEILLHPLVVLYDPVIEPHLDELRRFLNHPRLRLEPVKAPADWPQRERMLTALVKQAPYLVETPWTLKLDTDAIGTADNPEWCQESIIGRRNLNGRMMDSTTPDPILVASPWGYTKPPDAVDKLDEWAAHGLPGCPLLNLHPQPGSDLVRTPGRLTSWLCFGQTEWLRWAAGKFPARLPVPSHDTCLWYLAKMVLAHYRGVRFSQLGWEHCHGSRLAAAAAKVRPVAKPEFHGYQSAVLCLYKKLLHKKDPVGAEVGVYYGSLSTKLLSTYPLMRLHLVDIWSSCSPDSSYYKSGDRGSRRTDEEQYQTLCRAIRMTAFAHERRHVWWMPSVEAAAQIPNESLDFVFIDGAHDYESVKLDLAAWYPKVKHGGLFSGHDYYHAREKRGQGFGAGKAIDEFLSQHPELKLHTEPKTVWGCIKP